MNQDLLNQEVKANIIARINKLTPNSQPLWGKMSVSQMLAHCQAQLRVAVGDDKLKHSLVGLLFGKMAKRKLLEDKPFSKNLPTAPSFIVKETPEFNDAKDKLIGLITRFTEKNISKDPHPFFGKLTINEWSSLTWKHLDHHLIQFGV
jgi:hypothetical protein